VRGHPGHHRGRRRPGHLRPVSRPADPGLPHPAAIGLRRAAIPPAQRPRTRGARPYRGRGRQHRHRQAALPQPKTIRNHVSSIFTKLQVADRAQAIVRARAAGLGRQPGDLQ